MVCMSMQRIQSNHNVDLSTKSSNYMKIQLKALNYNILRNNTSDYSYLELDNS